MHRLRRPSREVEVQPELAHRLVVEVLVLVLGIVVEGSSHFVSRLNGYLRGREREVVQQAMLVCRWKSRC